MATQKILEKNFSVNGNTIVVNERVEKVLTLEDLQRETSTLQQRQIQIRQQMTLLKDQYTEMQNAINEIDTMIKSLPEVETPEL